MSESGRVTLSKLQNLARTSGCAESSSARDPHKTMRKAILDYCAKVHPDEKLVCLIPSDKAIDSSLLNKISTISEENQAHLFLPHIFKAADWHPQEGVAKSMSGAVYRVGEAPYGTESYVELPNGMIVRYCNTPAGTIQENIVLRELSTSLLQVH